MYDFIQKCYYSMGDLWKEFCYFLRYCKSFRKEREKWRLENTGK